MAFQSIPQSTFAGGFGRGVGQGLAEQIPKEVERVRLSQGLQNLGQGIENLSPMEQIAKLAGIPGMNAQTAAAFLPYIQQSQARKALMQRAESAKGSASDEIQSKPKSGYLERTKQSDYLVKPNSDVIDIEAAKLVKSGAYVDPNEARIAAEKRLNEQYATDQDIETKKGLGRTLLNNFIEDTGVDISGETKKRFETQATELMLDGGKSPEQMTQEMNQKLLDFSKAQTELKTLASNYRFAGRRKPIQESIQQTREHYKKLNILDQFEKDLMSTFGYSPEVASQFAYPSNKVPSASKMLNSLKSRFNPSSIAESVKLGVQGKTGRTVPENVIKELVDNWSPDIGIKGMAREVELRGFDPQSFISQLKQYSGTEKFTERQERELIQPLSSKRALGDLWLQFVETRKKV